MFAKIKIIILHINQNKLKYFRALVILLLSISLHPSVRTQEYTLKNQPPIPLYTKDSTIIILDRIAASPIELGNIFSKLTGIEPLSAQAKICLKNRNKIFFDDKEVRSDEILDGEEGAAVSIKIKNLKNHNLEEIYAKKDQTTCKILNIDANNTVIQPPELRQIINPNRAMKISEISKQGWENLYELPKNIYIETGETKISVTPSIGWQHIKNSLIYLLGIAILISLLETLIKFVLWKY